MQKISPCLWFNRRAEEAAQFYSKVFEATKIHRTTHYDETVPASLGMKPGEVMTIDFQIHGQDFTLLNADDHYRFTPATSLTVNCPSTDEVERLYAKLIEGGRALMPLDQYPFSERYGFIEDKFGVAWQLLFTKQSFEKKIVPSFIFVGPNFGKAEEAMRKYVGIFRDGKIISTDPNPKHKGAIQHGTFTLFGQEFVAMDGEGDHTFNFSGAISFQIFCDTQSEIDAYYESIAKDGKEQACGWVTDKFGISWQIIPRILDELIHDADKVRGQRTVQAMYHMRKFDIEKLKRANAGY